MFYLPSLLWGRRRAGALADDQFSGQPPGIWPLPTQQMLHEFHGRRA
jgi:hypothetical protein